MRNAMTYAIATEHNLHKQAKTVIKATLRQYAH